MSPKRPPNLFALVDDEDEPIRRIPLQQDLQLEVRDIFERQLDDLFADDPDEVEFDVRLTPDESEIFLISTFNPPDAVWNALKKPTSIPEVKMDEESLLKTQGLFVGDHLDRRILLQVFDKRRLLSTRGFTLISARGTFRRLEYPGITLDTQLAAGFIGNRLYFRSYYVARRLFDLSEFFREATEADLSTFSRHKAIYVSNKEAFKGNADSWVRKKVAIILQSEVLSDQPPAKIVAVAKAYGVPVTLDQQGKIIIPEEKRALKQVLRLLEESFFTSELSGNKYISNSKRRL